jgi:CheY-like chemotaxis protein
LEPIIKGAALIFFLRLCLDRTYNHAGAGTRAKVVTVKANGGALILVVDDDESVLEALADLLSVSGYEVARAHNGAVALDYLRQNPPPALVIHDLVMPVMDGWRLQQEMKKDAAMARLPVVVMSALSDPDGIDAEAILLKPFNITQFLEIVERLTSHVHPDEPGGKSGLR